MANIIRWNPMRDAADMVNEFDRMLEYPLLRGRWGLPLRTNEVVGSWNLALDVAEQGDAFTVKASLPGVNPDDLNVTLEDNVLTIQGETKDDGTIEENSYHIRERRYGSFSRSVRFPVPVEGDKVEASYENGVLTLRIPKAEAVKPKRIAVKAAA